MGGGWGKGRRKKKRCEGEIGDQKSVKDPIDQQDRREMLDASLRGLPTKHCSIFKIIFVFDAFILSSYLNILCSAAAERKIAFDPHFFYRIKKFKTESDRNKETLQLTHTHVNFFRGGRGRNALHAKHFKGRIPFFATCVESIWKKQKKKKNFFSFFLPQEEKGLARGKKQCVCRRESIKSE